MCDYCNFHKVDSTLELPEMPINFDATGKCGISHRKTKSGVLLDYWNDTAGEEFSTLVNYCCICGRKF